MHHGAVSEMREIKRGIERAPGLHKLYGGETLLVNTKLDRQSPMRPDQRVVVSFPLAELWDERGPVAATRGRRLGRVEIAGMLTSATIQFVVAIGAEPLRWISVDDRFTFWKDEVKPRVVPADAEGFYLGDYPGEYCYLATEWTRAVVGPTVVLLECHH